MVSGMHAAASIPEVRVAEQQLVASRIMRRLCERIAGRERLVVLDVGAGLGCTVDFFAQYNAHIYFVDLFSCELFAHPPKKIDVEDAKESITEYLQLPAGVVFDVCLFWDTLHCAQLTVHQGLSSALQPHIQNNTLGYGFGTLYAQSLNHTRYGIWDQDHLAVYPPKLEGQFSAYSRRELSEHFEHLTIQREGFLQGGRLELLLGVS